MKMKNLLMPPVPLDPMQRMGIRLLMYKIQRGQAERNW